MKLAEIKAILAGNPTEEQLTELKKDERGGKNRKERSLWPIFFSFAFITQIFININYY